MEALVLSAITNEITETESETVVTCSNDGSAQSCVGSYVVQSFRINGKQRALPTLNGFTESCASLKELQLMTYRILSAASGGMYSEKDIVDKIDFVVKDSTNHNLAVMEDVLVCNKLNWNCNTVPSALVCHVHPLMMFQRCVKTVFQDIYNAIGNDSIKECCVTDIDFRNESFIYKAIACLCCFINSDYSSKPWNRQEHFDAYIHPKKNESLSMKDHRFNGLF